MRAGMLVVVFSLGTFAAHAETAQVELGGTALALAMPDGHCRLDASNTADSTVIANIKQAVGNTNHVLLVFAECGQLEAVRSGRALLLHDFGSYMSPVAAGPQSMAPALFAQQMTEVYKSQGAAILKGAEATTRERISSMNIGMRVGEHRLIGVLRTDERASYLGIVQNLGLPDGTTKVQLALVAAGLIKQRIISLNLYTPFGEGAVGVAATERTLETAAKVYASSASANGQ